VNAKTHALARQVFGHRHPCPVAVEVRFVLLVHAPFRRAHSASKVVRRARLSARASMAVQKVGIDRPEPNHDLANCVPPPSHVVVAAGDVRDFRHRKVGRGVARGAGVERLRDLHARSQHAQNACRAFAVALPAWHDRRVRWVRRTMAAGHWDAEAREPSSVRSVSCPSLASRSFRRANDLHVIGVVANDDGCASTVVLQIAALDATLLRLARDSTAKNLAAVHHDWPKGVRPSRLENLLAQLVAGRGSATVAWSALHDVPTIQIEIDRLIGFLACKNVRLRRYNKPAHLLARRNTTSIVST